MDEGRPVSRRLDGDDTASAATMAAVAVLRARLVHERRRATVHLLLRWRRRLAVTLRRKSDGGPCPARRKQPVDSSSVSPGLAGASTAPMASPLPQIAYKMPY